MTVELTVDKFGKSRQFQFGKVTTQHKNKLIIITILEVRRVEDVLIGYRCVYECRKPLCGTIFYAILQEILRKCNESGN